MIFLLLENASTTRHEIYFKNIGRDNILSFLIEIKLYQKINLNLALQTYTSKQLQIHLSTNNYRQFTRKIKKDPLKKH